MNLIDKNQYTFSSELPSPCRILYDTIKNIELDIEYKLGIMEMRLSDAIRYEYWCMVYAHLSPPAYQYSPLTTPYSFNCEVAALQVVQTHHDQN